jgi:hypothetical protein
VFDAIRRLFGEKSAPAKPPAGDAMAVLDLKLGQRVRIAGSGEQHVAGKVDYERNGHIWHNYRLIDSADAERWLSVEFWEDEGMQTFLYTAVSLFELPSQPQPEQWFATAPDAKVPYTLVEEGHAAVAAVADDRQFLRARGLEPITAAVGDQLTFWQYVRKDYDREYLAIEIWGEEKYPSKGIHLDVNSIEVLPR